MDVRPLTGSTKIYKDQCVYCFNTPLHSALYIDFIRYWAHCEKHLDKAGEARAFLKHVRMARERKEDEDEDPPAKITRLAIGVDGGFDASKEQFEYTDTYTVFVRGEKEYGLDDSALPENLRVTARNVINFQSAGAQEQNAQWDGEERKVSRFANDLLQLDNGVKVPPGPWQCSMCEKRDNLWMNLTCGTILCGRKYYDGTGGNNHAVEYYERTKYPLAVKLGTITPQGADVYSYAEDDMVLNPNLAKHLEHFGINMMHCQQTEKTMTELEIDANMNLKFEYDSILESGVALKPLYGSGFLGLVNMGNTCYMNSVLQVLLNCVPDLSSKYLRSQNYSPNEVPTNFTFQLRNLAYYIQNPGDYSRIDAKPGVGNGVKPALLKSIIGKGHPEFSSTRQQDAHEYFLHLIDLLEKQEKNTPALQTTDNFSFEIEERLQCDQTQKVLYKTRREFCISLPLPLELAPNAEEAAAWEERRAEMERTGERVKGDDCVKYQLDLAQCLQALAGPELITDFLSPDTGRTGTARQSTALKTFPPYLMVQARRFTLTPDWQPKKLDVLLNVPDDVDLEFLRGRGKQEGEVEMSGAPAPAPLEPDMAIVEGLVGMGFAFEGCRKAAYHTKNAGLEAAMEWIFAHMEDPDFAAPLVIAPPAAAPAAAAGTPAADPESIEMICAMGFTEAQARIALKKCDNNLERAADLVLSNPDSLNEEEEATPAGGVCGGGVSVTDGEGKYRLRALISHIGTSTACGHYVCHIRDPTTGQWTIYNDEKVAVSVKPPKELAYLYLFERI